MTRLLILAAIAVSWSMPAAAEDARDAAAVIAVDDAWLQAEIKGDDGWLRDHLLPEYRSIGADGKVTTREQIVEHAHARGAQPGMAEKVAAWRAAHPSTPAVTVVGNTAILTWILTKEGKPVSSSDIFVYRDGQWRAIYSQHSTASS
ncbi:MAG TPA: nuclear transport factor 2 family protein [Sphingomonas sp.]|nr:nuclear transport factor 2 family protein [Sphingomonas sp.]